MKDEFKKVCDSLILENEDSLKKAREKVRITSKKNTAPAIIIVVSMIFMILSGILAENTNNIWVYLLFFLAGATFLITTKKFLYNYDKI